jgi:dihydroorotate dehydrogenase (fumarate)
MLIMHSIFQEQLEREQVALNRGLEQADNSFAESLSFLPRPEEFRLGPDEYLGQIARLKKAVKVPVVASLNGRTPGGWVDFAKLIQQAGADALELNIYDPVLDVGRDAAAVESESIAVIAAVRKAITIPIAVKLSPFYTSIVNFAHRVEATGVEGLVLFNRFYQPDIDIASLEVVSSLHLSTSAELLLRLRAVATLCGRVEADLAITGGVHTAEDVLKSIMAGAEAVQMVSALLAHGPKHLKKVKNDLGRWLEDHEYESLRQACGSMSLLKTPDPGAYERGNYMKILQSWSAH